MKGEREKTYLVNEIPLAACRIFEWLRIEGSSRLALCAVMTVREKSVGHTYMAFGRG